jgi:hypothetical protein
LDEEVGWLMQKKKYIHHEEGKVARRDLKLLQSNSLSKQRKLAVKMQLERVC